MMEDEKYMSEQIFVCGGGHQGLSMAAHLALNGVDVTLWNRTRKNIEKIIKTGTIFCNGVVNGIAKNIKASDRIDDVFRDTIMVTVPSNAYDDVAKVLAPKVNGNTLIILNPGRTFGAIDFMDKLKKYGVKEEPHIAETQTIVYTCRRSGENSATIFAMKNNVRIAALKNEDSDLAFGRIPKCLKTYFSLEESVVNTSLSNIGMILHCAPVLMNIGWIENSKVDFKYYYDGISETIANFIEKMDVERCAVASKLGVNVESTVEWMNRIYHVDGKTIYQCIKLNDAYKSIDAPPTINSRYILEDVPNGLVPIEYLGEQLQMKTPNITLIIDLSNSIFEKDFRKLGRRVGLERIKKILQNEC